MRKFEIGEVVRICNTPEADRTYRRLEPDELFYDSHMNKFIGDEFEVLEYRGCDTWVRLRGNGWTWHVDWLERAEPDVDVDCADIEDLL